MGNLFQKMKGNDMAVKVSEVIKQLQQQVDLKGDTELIHEDNECNLYTLSKVWYDEAEKCIRIG